MVKVDQYARIRYAHRVDKLSIRQLARKFQTGQVEAVIVYKVDRLSRSLLDFAKMMELFDNPDGHQGSSPR